MCVCVCVCVRQLPELTLLLVEQAASSRGGPAPAYAPLPSLAPLRRAHSGSELMGLTADAAAAGQEHRDEHPSEGGNSGSSTPTGRRMKKRAFCLVCLSQCTALF